MEVGMNIDDYLDDEQLKVVGLIGVVIIAMAAGPMLLMPSDDTEIEPNNGTVVTPDGTELQEVDGGVDRGPLGGLNALPASHLRDDESPTVHASAGAQTMRVETTTVGGEPALNLTDERTHDGRWVSVPTAWFNRTQDGVPSVARIAHEENGTYTEAIQVRGDSAAFYVRGFSTNTVTFGGELVIRDQPAVDGTRHTYQLDSRDSVDNLVINATGVTNAGWSNVSSSGVSDTDSVSIDVGGNIDPTGPSSNNEPVIQFTGAGYYNNIESSGDGTIDNSRRFVGDDQANNKRDSSIEVTPSQSFSTDTIKVNIGDTYGSDYGANVDVRVATGGVDDTMGEGTLVKDNWDPDWQTGEQEIQLDSTYQFEGGQTYEIEFITQNTNSDSANDQLRIALDDSASSTKFLFTEDITFSYDSYADIELEKPTTDPAIDIDGDGTYEASYSGSLSAGETVERELSTLSVNDDSGQISLSGGSIDIKILLKERTATSDPVVELNGQTASYNGTLAEGETVDLGGSVSWLEDGQNNVTVHVGDGSYSGDGPEPQVDIEFRHDLESPRTVDYESEALSERYNISKTYTTPRANATLTIPHARTVLSMRALDYRLNETGSWSSVPQSAANLSGTTLDVDVSALAGDPVPEGTTVEVRSTGSRVDAHDSEISVVRATPVGFDMNSRIQLESWNSESYLEVGETPQGGLVYYAENETYSAESDYVELYSNGDQRFYAPKASSGSEVTLSTLSARVSPERNSMRVRVPESVNATNTEFVVEPASVVGDSWTAEYVAGTDGQWYAVVDGSGNELGAAEKPDAIKVSRDDVGLVSIVPTEEPTAANSGGVGGGIFATATTGNLPSLIVLFGSVGMLFVAGTRPASSRDAVDGLAAGVGGLVGRIPRIGGALESAVESGLSSAGSGLVTVGENRLLTGAIGVAVAVAANEAGLYSIGSETGAILAVGGIAIGSLFLLREADEFTTARWIAIVAVAGVVALQGLGEGDLLAEFVNSDAFLIAVLIGGYAAIQLVREYRANNGPDDDRPQVVIGGRFSSGDDEGSD